MSLLRCMSITLAVFCLVFLIIWGSYEGHRAWRHAHPVTNHEITVQTPAHISPEASRETPREYFPRAKDPIPLTLSQKIFGYGLAFLVLMAYALMQQYLFRTLGIGSTVNLFILGVVIFFLIYA